MALEIVDIEPQSESDELLNLFLDFRDKLSSEYFPKDPITARQIQINSLKNEIPGVLYIRKALLDKNSNEIIARITVKMFSKEHHEYEQNKHIAELDVNVLNKYREGDLAKDLFIKAIEIINNFPNVTIVEGCCIWEQEWEVWKSFGARETYSADVNRVYLEEIDWKMIENWKNEGRKKAELNGVYLQSFENCPEEIIEEYSSLYTELLNLVPWGDLEWKPPDETPEYRRVKEERQTKLGKKWYTLISRENDGRISGLTEIFHNPNDNYWIHQLLTGVKPDFRGRGLGKWLKAEMLLFIKEELPEVILLHTGNAEVNAPMLSINKRIGFKKYLTDKCFTIEIEKLKTFL
ncbi:MAG: GNAT family N-acetyltransferase [Candidatus Heimdallarchaeota archaeon]|nr:GNAT family N-acetyltransferase [Candidatus Heimdallarchaeota archaeon]